MDTDLQRKVALVILDGWGINKAYPGNAITEAEPELWEKLWADNPHVILQACGEAVGLPANQMGNSEVGHEAIGAGRVVPQIMLELGKAAEAGTFHERPAIKNTFDQVKTNDSSLHIMGLLSPGGVHAHEDHIFGLIKEAKAAGIKNIFVHAFTDGRDVRQKSCKQSFKKLSQICKKTGAQIATLSGRYYAMDRDNNSDRTQAAFQAIKHRQGDRAVSYTKAINAAYKANITDEFLPPVVLPVRDEVTAMIKPGDGVIFANYRNDRPRQLTEAFIADDLNDISFTTMTPYNDEYPVNVAFDYPNVPMPLGEVLEAHNVTVLKTTETEKFPHVTFFMNAKRNAPFEGEERKLIGSNKVKQHAEKPEMKAAEISAVIVKAMLGKTHQVIIANICNGDMVGHSGNVEAGKAAVKAVDAALKDIVAAAREAGYLLFVTADHGNCDEMIGPHGEVLTEHSLNPVPFIMVAPEGSDARLIPQADGVALANIAPTLLRALAIPQPEVMTGTSLIA